MHKRDDVNLRVPSFPYVFYHPSSRSLSFGVSTSVVILQLFTTNDILVRSISHLLRFPADPTRYARWATLTWWKKPKMGGEMRVQLYSYKERRLLKCLLARCYPQCTIEAHFNSEPSTSSRNEELFSPVKVPSCHNAPPRNGVNHSYSYWQSNQKPNYWRTEVKIRVSKEDSSYTVITNISNRWIWHLSDSWWVFQQQPHKRDKDQIRLLYTLGSWRMHDGSCGIQMSRLRCNVYIVCKRSNISFFSSCNVTNCAHGFFGHHQKSHNGIRAPDSWPLQKTMT